MFSRKYSHSPPKKQRPRPSRAFPRTCLAFPGTCRASAGHLPGTFLLPSCYALPPKRPSVALFTEVRNAEPPLTCLPSPSRAHSFSRPATHFHPNGPLWHFSRKCVTPSLPGPASRAPPGHIPSPVLPRTSTQTALCGTFRGSAYRRAAPNLPPEPLQGTFRLCRCAHFHPPWPGHLQLHHLTLFGSSERTKTLQSVLSAALRGIWANKNAPKCTLGRPLGHLSEQKRSKVCSRLPFGASERTKTAQSVLSAALRGCIPALHARALPPSLAWPSTTPPSDILRGIWANKNAPKCTLGCPSGSSERTKTAQSVLSAALWGI